MTKTKITSNSRRRSGNVGLMIPMYVFTILFVALPILYLFLSLIHISEPTRP